MTETQEPVITPLNHPYMKVLQEQLTTQKRMYECLENRLVLMKDGYANKTAYEKNEIEILRIKTEAELDILKRVISEKEKYFVKYIQEFVVEVDEMEKNFDSLVKKAKPQIVSNEGVAHLFKNVKWDVMMQNVEVKLHFYKRLKSLTK